ncbi:MAG: DUF4277 domain-containing protein [Mycobacteriales bacterium]
MGTACLSSTFRVRVLSAATLTDSGADVKGVTIATDGQFALNSQRLGPLPVLNFFLARMGLARHLEDYLPPDDARLRIPPAVVIGLVVRNIAVSHRPVYAMAEWAAPYDPAVLGLAAADVGALNDDRVGRMLDRLFDADRASLMTKTVLGVIREFGVETAQLHNDSTTVTLTGGYCAADGRERGGKATPAIRHGHNKDFRPDLKQLLVILTVSADGAVPIAFRVADGNTPDDPTHIRAWEGLCALVGPGSSSKSQCSNSPPFWSAGVRRRGARGSGLDCGTSSRWPS